MLVWLNGSFGVGKTTTARLIAERDLRWRAFDPESVGYMLRANLSDQSLGGDFQHLHSWRRLVPIVAAEIVEHTGQQLIAVQSVLRKTYWGDLKDGMRRLHLDLFHVVLDADPGKLRQRIKVADDSADRQWRLNHVEMYIKARPWLIEAADLVVDTTAAPAEVVAQKILAAVD